MKDHDVDDMHEVEVSTPYTECFFIDRDYYVQTISNADETVLAFSVTTRNRRFEPTFTGLPEPSRLARVRERVQIRIGLMRLRREERLESAHRPEDEPFNDGLSEDELNALDDDEPETGGYRYESLFRVRLGHTRFSELTREDWAPGEAKGGYWPHGFSYSEIHYFGNPGYYLHYVFTASNGGGPAPVGPMDFTDQVGWFHWPAENAPAEPLEEEDFPYWKDLDDLHRFRRATAVTTYTVIGSMLVDDYPTTFGPHGDEVRTLS